MLHEIKIEFLDPGSKPHIFRLGLGPCGRVVKELTQKRDDVEIAVNQWVDDGDDLRPVTFVYPLRNVRRVALYEYDPNVCPLEV
ncbi:hypothetical protein [Chryseobacterium sp.]|uniref:hypothetical protein n=1 Tax=Chryseobacterium sp. TaxID=1871047 RepID=UPI003219C888